MLYWHGYNLEEFPFYFISDQICIWSLTIHNSSLCFTYTYADVSFSWWDMATKFMNKTMLTTSTCKQNIKDSSICCLRKIIDLYGFFIDWFQWLVKQSRVILSWEVRESDSLYIQIYIFLYKIFFLSWSCWILSILKQIYLTHIWDPHSCYCSGSKWTWE